MCCVCGRGGRNEILRGRGRALFSKGELQEIFSENGPTSLVRSAL